MSSFFTLTIISIVFSILLAWQIRKRVDNKNNFSYFIMLMLSVTLWSILALLETISPLEYKVIFAKLTYIGILSMPVLWLFFSLEYSQKHNLIMKKNMKLLWIVPSLTLFAVFTNDYHHLFWTKIYPYLKYDNIDILKYDRGIFFTINSIYSYTLLIIGIIIIFSKLSRMKAPKDFFLVVLGVLTPLIANALYLSRILHFDYTAAAFSFTCFCFAWAIISGFFERKLAIAETIHENMEEGIILIDENLKIANINHCAKKIIGIKNLSESTDAPNIIPFWDDIKTKLKKGVNEYVEVCLTVNQNRNCYGIHIYFISIESKISGWIVSLFDITEKKHNEEALKLMDGLLSGSALATSILLDGKDYQSAVYDAIKLIGQSAKADRVYLFENCIDEITGKQFTSQKFEWTSDSCEPQIDNPELQNVQFDDISYFIDPLIKGNSFIGMVSKMEDQSVKALLESQNIKSIIVLPLSIGSKFWGFIGFDNCTREREWTDAEEAILKAFINSVARAIEKGMVEKELEEGRKAAEAANIAKSNFLANMSHEIRTPLNGIIGFMDILAQTPLSIEQADYLDEIKNASDSLLYMINDVLDFSKIEADKMSLENITFNLHNIVEDAVSLVSPKAQNKSVELNCEIRAGVPRMVSGDPGRLRQVLNNLIGNAIKFTHQGEICVMVEKMQDIDNYILLKFDVSDTGIGMSKQVQKNLFKPFNQADNSTTRKYGGTGLGLAISKKIIELMGGDITVESNENEGAKFTFTVGFGKTNDSVNLNYTDIKGLNIMVVDHNAANRRVFRSYLEEAGCEVFESESVNQAIGLITGVTFDKAIDIALIEFNLPEINGFELGKIIQQVDRYNKIKIIITSYTAKRGDARIAKEAGFSGYLPKPIRKKDMFDTISAVAGFKNSDERQILVTRHVIKENALQSNKSILLVEDTEANRKLAITILKKMGNDCEVAINGKEAVDACKVKKYDLIIMDCQMPVMDGYEATKIIKNSAGINSSTPIIALTANTLTEDIENCFNAGMDDYISKPINMKLLETSINKWLRNS